MDRNQKYDRVFGQLHGLPDSTQTRARTIRSMQPLVGSVETFVVQTIRQAGDGDTVFLEYIDGEGSLRLVLPPVVTAAIAEQRDAITGRVRSRQAKAAAADRKARGITPFVKKARNG